VKKILFLDSLRCTVGGLALLTLSSLAWGDDSKKIAVTDSTFKCLQEMTPVRGFFVANLLGKLDDTVKVANSPTGGRYPPGTVIQLVPSEVMVKHQEGWNPATKDWEFFELITSAEGTKVKVRGTTEVVNRFGGNCFGCHVAAKPEWDLVCEKNHGCAPLPITTDRILAIQQADPRCKPPAKKTPTTTP